MFDTSIRDKALRARRQRLAEEQAELLDRVSRTLQELREPLGIESAYVVGSLRSPDSWREASDVDVAVGGSSAIVLEIMKALEEATGRAVDVVRGDRLRPGRVAAVPPLLPPRVHGGPGSRQGGGPRGPGRGNPARLRPGVGAIPGTPAA